MQTFPARWAAWVMMGIVSAFGAASLSAEDSGKPASAGERIALFDGSDLSHWTTQDAKAMDRWTVASDVKLDAGDPKKLSTAGGAGAKAAACLLEPAGGANLLTKQALGDGEYHVEFLVSKGSNSGVYLLGRYEVQIFDSYGKDKPGMVDTGAIYSVRPPTMNAAKPAGEWQTLDIVFRAPRFDATGKKTQSAVFASVKLNGRLIQENVEAPKPTGSGLFEDESASGPLMLQGDHGPVAYRNMWHTPTPKEK
jgi:hypothetical protein